MRINASNIRAADDGGMCTNGLTDTCAPAAVMRSRDRASGILAVVPVGTTIAGVQLHLCVCRCQYACRTILLYIR